MMLVEPRAVSDHLSILSRSDLSRRAVRAAVPTAVRLACEPVLRLTAPAAAEPETPRSERAG